MKVLVTGATGFIGSHLAEALLSRGAQVRALVRSPDRLRWLQGLSGVELRHGSLEDRRSLEKAVEDVDVVYHTAGVVKALREETYFQVNAGGTENLLEAVGRRADTPARFVLVSSQAAVGPSRLHEPLDEEAPARPITPYGKSKRKGEEIALQWKDRLPLTVVRPPAVYGPRDVDILAYFKLASLGIVPIPGFGERRVSLVHVLDLVQGLLRAGEAPEAVGEIFFITSGDHGWHELARALRKAVGRGIPLRFPVAVLSLAAVLCEAAAWVSGKPAALNRHKARELRQRAWLCSCDRARDVLGYKPRWSLEEGMAHTAEWYRNAGWIRK